MWTLYYWRDNGEEIDLLIDRKTEILPIEVKYRNNAGHISFDAFKRAFPGARSPVSIVITKDRLRREAETLYVPFWLVG